MKLVSRTFSGTLAAFLCSSIILLLSACGHGPGKQEEFLYVTAAPQTFLRDRVAPVYAKTGIVHNGDRVIVLERGKRWERVRNIRGEEGWLQDRYLVGENVYSGFQQLYRDHQKDAPQARGVLRADFRLHLTPGRDTDRLFLLKENEKIDLLQRSTVKKSASSAPPPPVTQAASSSDKPDTNDAKEEEKEYKPQDQGKDQGKEQGKDQGKNAQVILPFKSLTPAPKSVAPQKSSAAAKERPSKVRDVAPEPAAQMEDWWLVRTPEGHAGWILARMIDIDIPFEIAQYSEGQRIVAFFPLTTVHDSETNKDQPYYLVLLTEPKDGMPFDYNQLRLYSWNLRRHRYETAYRDRNVFGLLPVKVGEETFEKVGSEPTFTLRVRGEDGSTIEQKYRLDGVIVKRVLAPGETAVRAARAKPAHDKGKRRAK